MPYSIHALLDGFDNSGAARWSLSEVFGEWSKRSFSDADISSPWWYLHESEVRCKFIGQLVRELRHDGRFGIKTGSLVRVCDYPSLRLARSQDSLTIEELALLR